MKLLAVETSTDACSAALYYDGEIREKFALEPRRHSQLILPMIDELMAESQLTPLQLDGLALSRGPGSFTGVRIAAGVVQGIAFGADLPVVPISTLAALAQGCFNHSSHQLSFTAMDARMGEIFWGVYQQDHNGYARLLGEEAVTPAAQVIFPQLSGAGVGSGWGVYAKQLTERIGACIVAVDADRLPRAGEIAQLGADGFSLGQAVPVDEAMPVYLRDKVAKKESER